MLLLALNAPSRFSILPDDRRLVYVGRFDRRDPLAPACQWSASEVRLAVDGSQLRAGFGEKGADYWEVVVDGQPKAPLALKDGADTYTIDLGGPGRHQVRLVKRTEPFVGTTTILGFDTPAGRLLAAKAKRRQLLFVGDFPSNPRQAVARSEVARLLKSFFGGSVTAAVATMIDQERDRLTVRDIAELRAMIDKAAEEER